MSPSEFGGSRRPIVEGVRWSTAGRVSLQAVRIGVTLVLVRLLGPEDFGLMGAAFVVVRLFDTVHFSTGAAMVQRRAVDPGFASSLFALNTALGLALAALLYAAAAPLAQAYAQGPLLAEVFRALALGVAMGGAIATHRSLLRRRMDFPATAVVDLLGAITNGAIAIPLALRGYGVWSMVAGYLGSILLQAIVVAIRVAWVPRLRVQTAHLREVASFASNLAASHLLLFALTNLDSFLITRYLGASAMGYYALAQRIVNPSRLIVSSFIAVLNPALAFVQSDEPRFRREFGRSAQGVAFAIVPTLLGIAIAIGPFLPLVLDSTWAPVEPVARFFALSTVLTSFLALGDAVFTAKARTALVLRWTLVRGLALSAGYAVGLRWGLSGVAAGGAVALAVVFLPAFLHPARLIGLGAGEIWRELRPYLGFNLLMVSGAVAALFFARSQAWSHLGVFAATAGAGVLVYAAALAWWRPPLLDDLWRVLRGERV